MPRGTSGNNICSRLNSRHEIALKFPHRVPDVLKFFRIANEFIRSQISYRKGKQNDIEKRKKETRG